MQDVPDMLIPSFASTVVFVTIIFSVAAMVIVGIWQGGPQGESGPSKRRYGVSATIGMLIWLTIGAAVPLSGILETKMLPPRVLLYALSCFLLAMGIAVSPIGRRLACLPSAALVGFHAFRLPLELVLHHWYKGGTLPIQMTYEGHNFDIITGILAIVVGLVAWRRAVSKTVLWMFNVLGIALLATVVTIAVTSVPTPMRQYMNEPPVLLPFNFPYSWIVSVAVTGALLAHLVLFRNLLWDAKEKIG